MDAAGVRMTKLDPLAEGDDGIGIENGVDSADLSKRRRMRAFGN